jgi:hypothetical protein
MYPPIHYYNDAFGFNGRYAPLAVMDGAFLPASCGGGGGGGGAAATPGHRAVGGSEEERCSIYNLFKSGGGNPVPTIVAVTAEELELDALLGAVPPLTAAEMRSELTDGLRWKLKEWTEEKVSALMDDPWYKIGGQLDGGLEIDAPRAWARVVSDSRLRCPNGDLAGSMRGGWDSRGRGSSRSGASSSPSSSAARVRVYHEILNQGPGPGHCLLSWPWGSIVFGDYCPHYAIHGWDMFLLFGLRGSMFDTGMLSWFLYSWTDADKEMSERLQDYIWEFGASGSVSDWDDDGGGAGLRWPAAGYDAESGGAAIVLSPADSERPGLIERGMLGQSACAWHRANFGVWNQSLINR